MIQALAKLAEITKFNLPNLLNGVNTSEVYDYGTE